MKTLKNIGIGIVVALIVGAVISAFYGNQIIDFCKAAQKAQVYQKHLSPDLGQFYSVETKPVTEGDSTFIIGYKAQPQIKKMQTTEVSFALVKSTDLIQIEVPTNKVGPINGTYLIVGTVNGIPTTTYFVNEGEALKFNLMAKK